MHTLIRGGTLVTMNSSRDVFVGDIWLENSKIKKIAKRISPELIKKQGGKKLRIVDGSDHFVIPGLIQAHTHLVQCLFRGLADDMSLLKWLQTRIWPFEKNHNEKSIQASGRLALLEMQKLGTTSILDMATVSHTESLFEAVRESGMRYWGGKCLMDDAETSGPLFEDFNPAIKETENLIRHWHNSSELFQYALCPRFAVSCTEKMLIACLELQNAHSVLIHTHASESKEEVELVRKRTGQRNITYFDSLGLLNSRTVIVHGIHLEGEEVDAMARSKAGLVHCPSSNLKLASGIAPIDSYLKAGIRLGIGSDGAPCNNSMDPFKELHLTALLQKPMFGPEAMNARTAFELATLGGARILGCDNEIGSLEEGKKADVVMVNRSHPSVATVEDPYSALVYSCSGRDVSRVWIHGKEIVENGESKVWDEEEVISSAKGELKKLLKRAQI